jgi:ketosteroid isomerase-like protein
MSAENLSLIRAAYEAGSRGDWDGMFAFTAADFVWETDARIPNAGVYRGRAEVQPFFEDQGAPFERVDMELEQAFANGDKVVAFVRVRRRIRGSDAEIESLIGHLWTLRDGKAIRGQAFAKREEALEAAGIPAQPA